MFEFYYLVLERAIKIIMMIINTTTKEINVTKIARWFTEVTGANDSEQIIS